MIPKHPFFSLALFFLTVVAFFAGRMTVGSTVASPKQITARQEAGSNELPPRILNKSATISTGLEDVRRGLHATGGRPLSLQQLDHLIDELLSLVKSSPRAAVELARRDIQPPHRETVMQKLLEAWARQDSAAAWRWVSESNGENFSWIDTVLCEVAKIDSSEAWSYASEFAAMRPKDAAGAYVAAMKGLMHVGAYDDVSRLIEHAKLPEAAAHDEYGLHDLLASNWARYDPQGAAQWVENLLPGTDEYRQAVRGLGESWAVKDPAAAVDFVLKLPASPDRQHILRTAADEWTLANPQKPIEWLSKYAGSPDYDYIAAAVITSDRNVGTNFIRAIGWTSSIQSREIRMGSLTRIMEQWATRDPDEVRAFLKGSHMLPGDVRSELHDRLKRVGTLAH